MEKIINHLANYTIFYLGICYSVALFFFDYAIPKLTYGESYIVIFVLTLGGIIIGKINDAMDLLSKDK